MKTYTINWIAKVSGLASVEAESEAEAISKFNADAGCYIHDDDSPYGYQASVEATLYDYGHKVDSIEEEEES